MRAPARHIECVGAVMFSYDKALVRHVSHARHVMRLLDARRGVTFGVSREMRRHVVEPVGTRRRYAKPVAMSPEAELLANVSAVAKAVGGI